MKNKLLLIIVFFGVLSCQKEFLEIKSNKKLVIPQTLNDYRALLDKSDLMNHSSPYLGFIGADDFYFDFNVWNRITILDRKNAYIWEKDIFESNISVDWNNSYQQVFHSNIVLDGLQEIELKTNKDSVQYNEVKGSAYFYRAFAFYQIAQLFCGVYNEKGSKDQLGIPLRLNSDINVKTKRSTIAETYNQIVADLEKAEMLLPERVEMKTRPSKTAALALLSRVYLGMQNYEKSIQYSDLALKTVSLIDFNNLKSADPFPMGQYNDEVIFHSRINVAVREATGNRVDNVLYNSYSLDDLRKDLWFGQKEENIWFRGSYSGDAFLFSGLAVDELYVNKIECLVRMDDVKQAVETLNIYLKHRYDSKSFMPLTTENIVDPLELVLEERRKTLAFRGTRWGDLKRLNLEKSTEVTLERIMENQSYILRPNSKNYILPIPRQVMDLVKIEQNERE